MGIWILFFWALPSWAEDPRSVTLEPVIVESTAIAPPKVLDIPSGVGARSIEALENAWGVEQISLDHAEALLGLRRQPLVKRGLRTEVGTGGAALQWDAGSFAGALSHDQNVARGRIDGGYTQLKVDRDRWGVLLDLDLRSEDVRAGTLALGNRVRVQGSGGAVWRSFLGELKPYIQLRTDRYLDARSSAGASALSISNTTRDWTGGIQSDSELTRWLTMRTQFSYENLVREYDAPSVTQAQWSRANGRVRLLAEWMTLPWVEITGRLGGEAALGESYPLWDAGVEISSSHRWMAGGALRARRFALMPTALERFGDGAVLKGVPDLAPETGIRAAMGPWYVDRWIQAEINAFVEQAENAPMTIATSPTEAKTMALGGVWSRGIEFKGSLLWGPFVLKPRLTFQDVLNRSQIGWQQGQAIPGRPRWSSQTELSWERSGWSAGITHRFQSEDALDLGGVWWRPAEHQLDAYAGYAWRDFGLKVVATHLLPDRSANAGADFVNQAGPNLLELQPTETEVRIQCDFRM